MLTAMNKAHLKKYTKFNKKYSPAEKIIKKYNKAHHCACIMLIFKVLK